MNELVITKNKQLKKLNVKKVIIVIIAASLMLVSLIITPIRVLMMQKEAVSANAETILENIEIGSIIEDEPNYIALHYPVISSEKINNSVYEMVSQELSTFRTESEKSSSKEKSELYIDFQTTMYEENIISFEFKISKSIAGSKKVDNVKTMSFNLDTEEQVTLGDNLNSVVGEENPKQESTVPEEVDVPKENIDELKDKKLVALTFDDGPHSEYTKELLKILKEEDAKATFFVLGSRAKYYPEILKQVVSEGHQLGNHSYSHKQLTSLSGKKMKAEIDNTNKIIKDATGIEEIALRPPYGEVSKEIKENANTPIILWSVDPEDWKNKDAKKVSKSVIKNTKEGSIVLLHDIYPTTIEATKQIIKDLKKKGYTFVTVETMIKAKQSKTVDNKVYYNVR